VSETFFKALLEIDTFEKELKNQQSGKGSVPRSFAKSLEMLYRETKFYNLGNIGPKQLRIIGTLKLPISADKNLMKLKLLLAMEGYCKYCFIGVASHANSCRFS